MAYKSADEIAEIFGERKTGQPGEVKGTDLGTREVWSFWLTAKQVVWLSGQWFQENRNCNWDGRFGGKGQYGPDEALFFWELRMFPNKAGMLTVSRWIEDEESDINESNTSVLVDHPFCQYVTSLGYSWLIISTDADLMQTLMVQFLGTKIQEVLHEG